MLDPGSRKLVRDDVGGEWDDVGVVQDDVEGGWHDVKEEWEWRMQKERGSAALFASKILRLVNLDDLIRIDETCKNSAAI